MPPDSVGGLYNIRPAISSRMLFFFLAPRGDLLLFRISIVSVHFAWYLPVRHKTAPVKDGHGWDGGFQRCWPGSSGSPGINASLAPGSSGGTRGEYGDSRDEERTALVEPQSPVRSSD